jgi:hypothetical protein
LKNFEKHFKNNFQFQIVWKKKTFEKLEKLEKTSFEKLANFKKFGKMFF